MTEDTVKHKHLELNKIDSMKPATSEERAVFKLI